MDNNQLQPDLEQISAAFQLLADQVPQFARVLVFQQQNDMLNLLRDIQARLADTQAQLANIHGQLADIHGQLADVHGQLVDVHGQLVDVREI